MVQSIYQTAELYHDAFNFRNTEAESALLTEASDRWGNGGRNFLELACGNCPYAEALIRAGVTFHGLDLSTDMLAFTRDRLAKQTLPSNATLHHADMRHFAIPYRFDLAFVLMGSLQCLTNDEFLDHLDQVYKHLNPGGLYIMEWCIEYEPTTQSQSNWTEESPSGVVGVHYTRWQHSVLQQSFEERLSFTLNGKLAATTTDVIYLRYPNEFALLLQTHDGQWEVVGHYNNWDLDQPLASATAINRPLCILRRNANNEK